MLHRCLIALVGILGFSAAYGVELGSGKYDVYRIPGSGGVHHPFSYYIHGKEQFVLLHGDIATPLLIPPGASYEIAADDAALMLTAIDGVGGQTGTGGTSGPSSVVASIGLDFGAPLLVNPVYDVTQSDFSLLVEGQDYYWGDFDGDGNQELLIVSPGGSQYAQFGVSPRDSFVMVDGGSTSGAAPTVGYEIISGLLADEVDIFGNTQFVVRDSDGDGRDELVALGNHYVADTGFEFNSNGGVNHVNYMTSPGLQTANVVGTSDGNFRVSELGAAVYSVPISVPAGTAGVAPEIGLTYSSHGGVGIAGQGWTLSAGGSITRCRQTLSQDGDAKPIKWSQDDRFCLNGRRLVVVEGEYGASGSVYKTEIDSHVYVTAYGSEAGHPDYFTLEAKDGSVSYYGATDDAQQNGIDGQTLTWAQNRFEDNVGNAIDYVYTKENSGDEFHISEIYYAYGSGTTFNDAHARITFEYNDAHPTRQTRYVAGQKFDSQNRLTSIKVENKEPLSPSGSSFGEVRTYTFHYAQTPVDAPHLLSQLDAIQECVGSQCLPATKFAWENNHDFDLPLGASWRGDLIQNKSVFKQFLPIDINGDGYNDFAWLDGDEIHTEHDYLVKYRLFDPETKEFVRGYFADDGINPSREYQNHTSHLNFDESPHKAFESVHIVAIDYNADGRQDLALYREKEDVWYVFLSKPMDDGSWRLSSRAIVLDSDDKAAVFVDLDSDGLADMLTQEGVYFSRRDPNQSTSSNQFYHYDSVVPLELLNSDGSQFESDFDINHRDTGSELEEINGWGDTRFFYEKRFMPAGDVNADGKSDVILVDRLVRSRYVEHCFKLSRGEREPVSCSQDEKVIAYYFDKMEEDYYLFTQTENANGSVSFERVADLGTETEWHQDDVASGASNPADSNNSVLAQFITQDFNGDGLTDIIKGERRYFKDDHTGIDYQLYINTGDGFLDPVLVQGHDDEEDIAPQIVDLNGDGLGDFLWIDREAEEVLCKLWDANANRFSNTTINVSDEVPAISTNGSKKEQHFFYDSTADGHMDYFRYRGQALSFYENKESGLKNLITSFTNGLGAKTDLTFESLINSEHYDRVDYIDSTSQRDRTYTRSNGETISWRTTAATTSIDDFYRQINQPYVGVDGDAQSFVDAYQSPVLQYHTPLFLVTRVESSAPTADPNNEGAILTNSTSAIEYVYEQAKLRAAGRGFLGFKALTTLDWQTGVKVQTQYRQDWPFIGSPAQTISYTADYDKLKVVSNEWEIVGWDSDWVNQIQNGSSHLGPLAIFNAENIEQSYQFNSDAQDPATIIAVRGISAPDPFPPGAILTKTGALEPQPSSKLSSNGQVVLQTVTTTQKYDTYGNPYEITAVTEGDGLSITKTTKNDYDNDNDYEILGDGSNVVFHDGRSRSYRALGRLTSTEVITEQNGEESTRRSTFSYHANGMLHTETVEPNEGNDTTLNDISLTTTHYYNALGNEERTVVTGIENIYGVAGTVVSTQPIHQTTETHYDDVGRYAMYSINTLGHQSPEVVARNIFGSPTRIESRTNSLTTTINYDTIGRETSRSDDTGARTDTEFLSCAQAQPSCPSGAVYAVKTTLPGGAATIEYFDKLARAVQKGQIAFDGTWVFTTQHYDASGNVVRVSEPHRHGQESGAYWTQTFYDSLNRAVQVIFPDTSTATTYYKGNVTETVNDLGHIQRETSNALGQLVSVEDNLGGVLEYAYTFDGKLRDVTFVSPNAGESSVKTSLTYDVLGRKLTMSDEDKGDWEYKYNALGQLVWQRDGKGQVVMQTYDPIGRMLSRADYHPSGGLELHTQWYYDTMMEAASGSANMYADVAGAVGQPTAVVVSKSISDVTCDDPTVQQCVRYTYDQFSRGKETKTLVRENSTFTDIAQDPFHEYITSVTYDGLGRVDTTQDALSGKILEGTNAFQSGVSHEYRNGYLSQITDLRTGELIQDIESKSIRGQITEMQLGLITRTNNYDEVTGQLKGQGAFVGASSFVIQDLSYTWDTIGNLTSRTNNSHTPNGQGTAPKGLFESFCYDGLNRLIKSDLQNLQTGDSGTRFDCSTLTDAAQYDQEYDAKGNITRKQNVSYSYSRTGGAGPHAVTATSDGGQYHYDANGNMVSNTGPDGTRVMNYTSFDKPYMIERGNHRIEFKYGHDRARYWRQSTNTSASTTETTIYLGNVEKIIKNDGTVQWKRYIPGGVETYNTIVEGDSYGLIEDPERNHIFKEHLGSVDVITDATGTVVQSMSFDAWGQRRAEATWSPMSVSAIIGFDRGITKRGYTGHEMLDEVGLIHMNGRIYDAKLARFLQADPIVQAAKNTQSYNRYSYVWNNPLNATDPSGFIRGKSWMKGFKQAFAIVATVVAAATCGLQCGWQVYATIAAIGAALNGADAEGVLIAAVSAGAMAGIGAAGWDKFVAGAAIATVGGITSVLQGGKFGHGFVSSVIGQAAGGLMPKGQGFGQTLARIGVAAVAGGTASKVTGGKFANGAVTGAFSAAVREGAGAWNERDRSLGKKTGVVLDKSNTKYKYKDSCNLSDGCTYNHYMDCATNGNQAACSALRVQNQKDLDHVVKFLKDDSPEFAQQTSIDENVSFDDVGGDLSKTGRAGETDPIDADIRLHRRYLSRADLVDTLAHELSHRGEGVLGRAMTHIEDHSSQYIDNPYGGPRHQKSWDIGKAAKERYLNRE